MKKIIISTGGGDAPGLNAVIYAVVKTSYKKGWEVYGSKSGYGGFLDMDDMVRLTPRDVEGIYATGGTILGSTNKGNPFAKPVENLAGEVQVIDVSDKILKNFNRMGFDCHIAIGGDGSLDIAHRFSLKGMPVIGVPIQTRALNGVDSLYSIVQMPRGFPVATMAIGAAGAANAGLMAAGILALTDPALAARLDAWRDALSASIPEEPQDD